MVQGAAVPVPLDDVQSMLLSCQVKGYHMQQQRLKENINVDLHQGPMHVRPDTTP